MRAVLEATDVKGLRFLLFYFLGMSLYSGVVNQVESRWGQGGVV